MKSVNEFKDLVASIKAESGFRLPMLSSIGRRVVTKNGTVSSVRFPVVNGPGQNTGTAAIFVKALGIKPAGVQTMVLSSGILRDILEYFAPFEGDGQLHANIDALKMALASPGLDRGEIVATLIFDDVSPEGVDDATLKLYGLSLRHFRPNQLNFAGIFGKLPNVAWVGDEPMDVAEVGAEIMRAAFQGSKFAPCRIGGFQMLGYLKKISEGKGKPEDLGQLRRISQAMQKASLCGLGQTATNPVLSTLKYFEQEYNEHIQNKRCPAGKCSSLVT